MQSTEFKLKENVMKSLLHVARQSIQVHLKEGRTSQVSVGPDADGELSEPRASFVTLKTMKTSQLRGCIGSLQATEPLINNVVANAQKAAFSDVRFVPITEAELTGVLIEISVLSPLHPVQLTSLEHLVQQLQPGMDGLVLSDGQHQGTFLPEVWKQLPNPHDFVSQLWLKAGLAADHWSETVQCLKYSTLSFQDAPSSTAPTLSISA